MTSNIPRAEIYHRVVHEKSYHEVYTKQYTDMEKFLIGFVSSVALGYAAFTTNALSNLDKKIDNRFDALDKKIDNHTKEQREMILAIGEENRKMILAIAEEQRRSRWF